MSNLRQVIEEAMASVTMFRNPDLTEFREKVSPILGTIGNGTLGSDRIVWIDINESEKVLEIQTEYSVCQCIQSGWFELPFSVIDAADPIVAAKAFGKEQRIREAKARLKSAQIELAAAEKLLKEEEDS